MLVLRLLKEEEKYGYQIISELKEKSNGRFALKEGTLYPVLYR
ncbi:MAG: helix-turn-helix transcriptional regulator, partial [Bariatricus sp.]|nr:helix-turn-helix transcriptional regulator [Bariatricus sp.]